MIKSVAMTALLLLPAFGYAFEKNTFHLNTRTEMNAQPSAKIEIGEAFSTRSAFYLGALLPSTEATNISTGNSNPTNNEININYIYSRVDYYFDGVFEKGFYIGGTVSYADINYEVNNDLGLIAEDAVSGLGAGIQVGYLYSVGNVTIGASLKGQAYSYDTTYEYEQGSTEGDTIIPHHEQFAGSVDLGYKF